MLLYLHPWKFMAHVRFHFQAPECGLIYFYYNSISTFQFLSQIPHSTRWRLQALYNLSECSYQSSAFIGYQPLFIQGKVIWAQAFIMATLYLTFTVEDKKVWLPSPSVIHSDAETTATHTEHLAQGQMMELDFIWRSNENIVLLYVEIQDGIKAVDMYSCQKKE